MAEVFAGAVMQVLFEKLASGGINQILKHVKGKKKIDPKIISNLKKRLKMFAAMLNDAQQRRIQSEAYTVWVEDLQDLAFDLEDILDEVATDAQLQQLQQADDENSCRRESKPRSVACLQSARTMVKNILTCGCRAAQRFHSDGSGDNLPSKIEEMISRLEKSHAQGLNELGLSVSVNMQQGMNKPTETTMPQALRETKSLVQRTPYGRDNRKNEIIQKLLLREEPSSSNKNYAVIAIVGNGGIGKTTLAQYVYNDPKVKDHFDFKAWVCVSDEAFDVARVTRDIINSATGRSHGTETLDLTQRSLIDKVKDKRFLIVLDDVWTDKYGDWDLLRAPFQYGAAGSRVIVTTRIEHVAKMMATSGNPTHFIINLGKLSDDDCWRIFLQHLGLPDDRNVDDDLAEMQNDIIQKCDGLPLAAKALGGLFKMEVSHIDRQSLLDSPIWSEKADVLSVLRLSYFHLPPYLKHIFAYSSIFPKDYAFGETEVVLLWMVQGFLPENSEESMEVIGQRYFFQLVSRSLFEPSPSRNKCYVMHDLVHDLSQLAAGDVCCCVTDAKDMSRNGLSSRTRHLNLWSNVTDPIDQTVTQKLRTFISENEAYVGGSFQFRAFFSRIHCLRTLSLVSEAITVLPECIGDLKHLRYLDLKLPKIRVLPKSIGNLYNLQTLFLIGCDNLRESIELRFLVKLRHLRFPRSLWEATPLGIRKLTNLQTLGDMYLGADHGRGSIIKDLRNLNHLHGKLQVIGLEKVRKVEDAREVRLHEKTGIEKLHLRWSGDGEYEVDDKTKRDVLEQLKPNSCIKSYKLDGYMGLTLPSWLGDPSFKNMVDIKLVDCEKFEWIPPLGLLPSLKKLWVEGVKVWAGWLHDSKATFPCLEELVIKDCDSFQGSLPPHLPCLKILIIVNCPKARLSPPNFKSRFTGPVVGGSCHTKLDIVGCNSLVSIDKMPLTVAKVRINQCPNLKRVEWEEAVTSSASIGNRVSIVINNCDSVVNVGNIPSTVEKLTIKDCKYLETVICDGKWKLLSSSEATDDGGGGKSGGGRLQLAHLNYQDISRCPNIMTLLDDVLLPSVQDMYMWHNDNQGSLPKLMHTFTSLDSLSIKGCPKIHKFPEGGLPRTLTKLHIEDMNIKQPIREWGLDHLTHLCFLIINKIGSSGDSVERIMGKDIAVGEVDDNHSILYLPSTSLNELYIDGFKNLKSINCSTFPNLSRLFIQHSPDLESLSPNNCLPPQLTYAIVDGCPLTDKHCKPNRKG